MQNPLYKLFLTFLLVFSSVFSLRAQCLPGWNYYAPVTITNNTTGNLSAYQAKITINTVTWLFTESMHPLPVVAYSFTI